MELIRARLAGDDARRLLAAQDGILHLDQLRQLGVGRPEVARLLRRRLIRRAHKGVYVVERAEHSQLQQLRALWMRLPRGILSHRSAAVIHGLEGATGGKIDLTCPHSGIPPRRGLRFHRRLVAETDVELVDGLPVTSVPRTLMDLAGVLNDDALAYAVDHALRTGRATYDDLSSRLEAVRRKGVEGVRRMERILKDHRRRGQPLESALEVRWWRIACREGLPRMRVQVPFCYGRRTGRMDFLIDGWDVCIETVGAAYHSTPEDIERDARRMLQLLALGFIVISITWKMLDDDTDGVVRAVREVIAARTRRRSRRARKSPPRTLSLAL